MSEIRIDIDSVAFDGAGAVHPGAERLAVIIGLEIDRLVQRQGMPTVPADRDARQVTVIRSRAQEVETGRLIAGELAAVILRVLSGGAGDRVQSRIE